MTQVPENMNSVTERVTNTVNARWFDRAILIVIPALIVAQGVWITTYVDTRFDTIEAGFERLEIRLAEHEKLTRHSGGERNSGLLSARIKTIQEQQASFAKTQEMFSKDLFNLHLIATRLETQFGN